MAKKPTGGGKRPPSSPPASRDSGRGASSIAGKALANGGRLSKAETLTIAGSVLSQNQKP